MDRDALPRKIEWFQQIAVGLFVLGFLSIQWKNSGLGTILLFKGIKPESINVALIIINIASSLICLIYLYTQKGIYAFSLFVLFLSLLIADLSSGFYSFALWASASSFAKILIIPLLYLYQKKHYKLWSVLIKLAIVLIFLSHGVIALKQYPIFIDYIINFYYKLTSQYLSESKAITTTVIIGSIDIIVVAFFIFFPKSRPIIYWMILWAFITATWRVIETGWWNLDAFALRSIHFLLPIIWLKYLNNQQ